ncbi:hypothetical protein NC652_039065 [Populus alba x Populus x berolinensis]|nr:hypothetical protein NC652_039065 [Populus alba x Populus x berolinensis]
MTAMKTWFSGLSPWSSSLVCSLVRRQSRRRWRTGTADEDDGDEDVSCWTLPSAPGEGEGLRWFSGLSPWSSSLVCSLVRRQSRRRWRTGHLILFHPLFVPVVSVERVPTLSFLFPQSMRLSPCCSPLCVFLVRVGPVSTEKRWLVHDHGEKGE